jgi:GNAT superfamily N-acetyltransferase
MKNQYGLKSLGHETTLMLIDLEGRVERRDGYYLGEWPGLPDFFWGNLLIFDEPPKTGDLKRWTALFKKEFGHNKAIRHVSLAWDGTAGERGVDQPFLDAGFLPVEAAVQMASRMHAPPQPNNDVEVRILEDGDWAQAIECNMHFRPPHLPEDVYREYAIRWHDRFRALCNAGHGNWFGAFQGHEMVATCGILVSDGLGRYQEVVTKEAFRGRGIASQLVSDAGRYALAHMGAKELVITADVDSTASRIYQSVGLIATQKEAGVFKRPPKDSGGIRNATVMRPSVNTV